jgi:hypothetical protein
MFQNVLMDPKILKKKQISLFLSMSFDIFVSFQKKKLNHCVFPISYTCLHVISYKCKYLLFHLNMLNFFQEINMFLSFFNIKLVSNKKFSIKYLIQGFNPHLLN